MELCFEHLLAHCFAFRSYDVTVSSSVLFPAAKKYLIILKWLADKVSDYLVNIEEHLARSTSRVNIGIVFIRWPETLFQMHVNVA